VESSVSQKGAICLGSHLVVLSQLWDDWSISVAGDSFHGCCVVYTEPRLSFGTLFYEHLP